MSMLLRGAPAAAATPCSRACRRWVYMALAAITAITAPSVTR